MSFKLTAEERAALERIAAERDVTLSHAIREGLRLYAQEWRERGASASDGREVAVS
jgi:hypothetical protein